MWLRFGWGVFVVTTAAVGLIWFSNPLPTESMFLLLSVGGIPAAICFLVAIFKVMHARRAASQRQPRWTEWSGTKEALAGLLLLLVSAAALGCACFVRTTVQEKWVREAESVVVSFLRNSENLRPYPITPDGEPPELGDYIALRGDGYGGALWNIQGYEYLVAKRIALFENGELPVTVYVEEGAKVAPSRKDVFVRMDQWGTGLREGSFGQGIAIHVSHPDLH